MTGTFRRERGSRPVSSTTAPSPPCASIIWRSFSRPAPLSSALISISRPSCAFLHRPANSSIFSPSRRETSSSGPFTRPASTSMASFTSKAFPMCEPSGSSMPVIRAATRRPACRPISTMVRPSSSASGRVRISAPPPTLISSTMPSAPIASFFDITDDAIKGIESTVDVTSRRA